MSQAATPMETAHGYSPPSVTQFSVFLHNKVGKLHDLVEVFEQRHALLAAISVNEAGDHAVVRIIVDPKSLLYLGGVTVDFKDEIIGRGFVFHNPNATASCGCGSSFSV